MYEDFFGLTKRPFTLRPDPSFLYLSNKHALALSMLEFGLTGQAGIVVVTGEIGSGKTTLIRHFLKCEESQAVIGVISNTHADFGDILQWACQALGVETKSESRSARYQAFTNYLAAKHAAGNQVVLIVDEAQNLSISALEELRLLSNIDLGHDQTLQIILVGQPELMKKLKGPRLCQFAQRISVHYHLSPLTYQESCAYITHRLAVAGTTEAVFDTWAMAAVYYFADGVPRLINSICDMAMVYAYATCEPVISIDTVLTVVRDREKNGIQTLPRRSGGVAREDLIEKAIASFEVPDQSRAAAEGVRGVLRSLPVMPPAANVPSERTTGADKEPISFSWAGDGHAATSIHREAERASRPVAAVYLTGEVPYRDGALGAHKLGAFQWLRRHLNTQREH
ncbi:MAG TPA: AAA family ATPase [Vicinamibacterales bacterium]|jgi:general secretion pathway protein A|nr:AAA family ATPase [Vicinamibacterales bacterium]